MNIVKMLEMNVDRHPWKEAIIYQDRRYTYDEFNKKVNQLAHGLMEIGIEKGDKVALMMKNSDYFAITYYACAKIGAVLVPMNFRLLSNELNYIINQSDSKHIITDSEFEEVIFQAVGDQTHIQNLISVPKAGENKFQSITDLFSKKSENPGVNILNSDLFHILYTSGTTGSPKGAIFDHGNVNAVSLSMILTLGYHSEERMMNFAPLFHAAQLIIGLVSGLYVGGLSVIYRDFNPQEILSDIGKYKITSFLAVPTMHMAFLQVPKQDNFNFSTVQKFIYGAAPMSEDVVRKCMEYFGSDQFYSLCGQTEGGPSGIILYPKDHKKYAGMAGRESFAYTLVDVVDEEGLSINPGEVGEMILKGPTIMKEYYKNPKATAETIRDGWLYTGDLALRDEDNYIKLIDRKKDMIITGGENVYSVEIENIVGMHPGIADVAIIGTPDPMWGELVTAIVVPKVGEQLSEQDVMEFTKQHLAGYKIPKKVIFTESLPRNASGKLMKYRIRAEVDEIQN